jgi:hypothetical protein
MSPVGEKIPLSFMPYYCPFCMFLFSNKPIPAAFCLQLDIYRSVIGVTFLDNVFPLKASKKMLDTQYHYRYHCRVTNGPSFAAPE